MILYVYNLNVLNHIPPPDSARWLLQLTKLEICKRQALGALGGPDFGGFRKNGDAPYIAKSGVF